MGMDMGRRWCARRRGAEDLVGNLFELLGAQYKPTRDRCIGSMHEHNLRRHTKQILTTEIGGQAVCLLEMAPPMTKNLSSLGRHLLITPLGIHVLDLFGTQRPDKLIKLLGGASLAGQEPIGTLGGRHLGLKPA
jgi:hypothetical protein